MRNRLLVTAVVAASAALIGGLTPAGAFPVEANSASLNPGSTCSVAAIAFGFANDVGTGNFITRKLTTADGTVLSSSGPVSDGGAFDNAGPMPPDALTGAGVNVNPVQPAGTIIGFYYALGDNPSTVANTGEFFVAYRCGLAEGASEEVYSCFGPLGTCPTSAADIPVDPITPVIPVADPIDLSPRFTG